MSCLYIFNEVPLISPVTFPINRLISVVPFAAKLPGVFVRLAFCGCSMGGIGILRYNIVLFLP